MKQFLLFTFAFTTFLTHAQNFQIADQYALGGSSNDSPSDALVVNNHTIIGGVSSSGISGDKTTSNFGDLDLWVVSVDNTNSIVWQKSFGGTGLDNLVKIIETSDGNFLIGGSSDSGVNGNKTSPNKGLSDFWLIKIDAQGNELWQKSYGGDDDEFLGDMVDLPDGSFLIAGASNSPISGDKTDSSRGLKDYWIVKIDASGNVLWDKTFGGSNNDYPESIDLDDNGNIFITGLSLSPLSGDKTEVGYGSNDAWVVKLDSNGNILWDKSLGGSNSDRSNKLLIVENNLYVLGASNSGISGTKTEPSRGMSDYWVTKMDLDGNIIMDKAYGGNNYEYISNALFMPSGELILVGATRSDASGDLINGTYNSSQDFWILVVDTNNLEIKSQFIYGGNEDEGFPNVIRGENNSIVLFGGSESDISGNKTESNKGGSDFWILELSTDLSTSNFQKEETLSFYPNPTSNSFQINEFPDGGNYELNIIDMMGKSVLRSNVSSLNNVVDVNSLNPGMYTLQMIDGEKSYTSKLIVE